VSPLERFRPWWIALAVFYAALTLCGPWGDYPLNDDWLYARTAKRLAETGTIVVDEFAAAPGVVQALIAAPFIKVFGFSHTLLRILTIAAGGLGLWCVDRLLRHAGCAPRERLFPMLLLALNPFYFYLSATFMTEIHGLVAALLAAVLWFRGRARSRADGPMVGVGTSLLVGAIMGGTFWARQNCIVWFGALVAASVLRLAFDREWLRLRRSLLPLASGAAAFAVMIGLYFLWARASGNLTPQFSQRLAAASSFDPRAWALQTIIGFAYLSVFLAPLLLLVRWRGGWLRPVAWTAGMLLASILGAEVITAQGGEEQGVWVRPRRYFPYLPNVLFNAGLGPITFAEVSRQDFLTWPHWPRVAFRVVHAAAVVAGGLWGLLLPRLGSFFRDRRPAMEIFLFGAFGAALSLALTIQGSGMYVLDRYHLPGVLGGVLALGAFLGFDAASGAPARPASGWLRFGLPWLALSVFSVAGLHDHFRWNDARWTLVRDYLREGGSPQRLQAGYETNAWLNYDAWHRHERPPYEDGCCHCDPVAVYCLDDTWWVGMAAPFVGDYRVVRSIQPRYWLTLSRRPVSLYRRK